MKILHVLTTCRAEGTPKLCLDWLNENHPKVSAQEVLFLSNQNKDLEKDFLKTNHSIYFTQALGKGKIASKMSMIDEVRKKVKSSKPDLVICWNQGFANWITIGVRLGGTKKLIIHAGCSPENKTFISFDHYVFWPSCGLGAKVACASQHIYSIFQSLKFFPIQSFKVINNCVKNERFLVSATEFTQKKKYQAIHVGNLESAKDHESLIDIWDIVIKNNPDANLLLIGKGSLEKRITEKINSLNLSKNISLMGYQSNPEKYLKESSIFCFTSTHHEGFGTVLIEALSSGLQVISFDEPGPKEALNGGKFGKVISQRNKESFANSVLDTFKNPISFEYVLKNQEYTQSFSVKYMMDQYIKLANA